MRFFIHKIQKRWLTGCLLFFLVSCANRENMPLEPPTTIASKQNFYRRIDSTIGLLQNGDLIFRNGTDDVSRAARSMNRVDTSFSHCGFVLMENDSAFVYHAIGGIYNPGGRLRRDPIDSFLIPGEADRFAIYRYSLTKPQADSLVPIIKDYYSAGLRFDVFFNFYSNDKMYCSEFIFKSLDQSMAGELSRSIANRDKPITISPDDLFLYRKSQLIKRVDFQP